MSSVSPPALSGTYGYHDRQHPQHLVSISGFILYEWNAQRSPAGLRIPNARICVQEHRLRGKHFYVERGTKTGSCNDAFAELHWRSLITFC